jgi:WD40 repeat protein
LVRDPTRGKVGEYRLNAIHPGGRLAAVGTTTGVTLLALDSGLDVGHMHLNHNWNVAFDPTTGDLLTSGQMGLFRWPVAEISESPGQLRIGPPRRLPVDVRQMDHAVRISGSGKTLVAVQGDRAVIFNDGRLDKPVILPREAPTTTPLILRRELAVSPDGQWIATGKFADSGELRIWDAKDGSLVKSLGVREGMSVCFSPDGKWLLANNPTHYHFWRVGTWEKGPQTPVPWKWWAGEPTFSPDGTLIAIERGDGALRLIESATGRELAVLEDPQLGRSTPVSFTPDGTQLLLTNTDYQVLRLWDLRKLREGLQSLGLDWDAPAYPPAKEKAHSVEPLSLVIDFGEKTSPLAGLRPSPQSATSLEPHFGPLMQVGLVAGAGHKLTSALDGRTNSTVLKIDGKDVLFGSTEGLWKSRMTLLGKGSDGRERRGFKSVWTYHKLTITQRVEIVPNAKELRDTCLISYAVENKDDQPHQVGVRVLVDTMIVENDGHPFAVPGQADLITTSADYRSAKEVPAYVQALQKPDAKDPGLVAYFTLKMGQSHEGPDRFSITKWTDANQYWEIPVEDIDGDAAAVIYWNPRDIPSRAQRTVSFAYGLCVAPPDTEVQGKQVPATK